MKVEDYDKTDYSYTFEHFQEMNENDLDKWLEKIRNDVFNIRQIRFNKIASILFYQNVMKEEINKWKN